MKVFKRMNNKGIGYIDAIFAIVIIGVLIKVVSSYDIHVIKSIGSSNRDMLNVSIVNEVVSDAYNNSNWENLIDKTLTTTHSHIDISYDFKKIPSKDSTEVVDVTFTFKEDSEDEGSKKVISLERSIYE